MASPCFPLPLRHAGAGVDEIVVNVGGVHLVDGPAAALTDLREIVLAWNERKQRP